MPEIKNRKQTSECVRKHLNAMLKELDDINWDIVATINVCVFMDPKKDKEYFNYIVDAKGIDSLSTSLVLAMGALALQGEEERQLNIEAKQQEQGNN